MFICIAVNCKLVNIALRSVGVEDDVRIENKRPTR